MLKESMYNYKLTIPINGVEKKLIYNTKSRKLLDCNKDDIRGVAKTQRKILVENGFLVDEKKDEALISQYYRLNRVFQNDVLSITIIPTADCNFRCVYCYQTSKDAYIKEETVERIIRFISRNIKHFSTLSISWFGGEPLLCKREILYIMQSAKEICDRERRVLVSYMTTNGYELDPSFFRKALSYGLRYYQITVDGEPEEHNSLRPHITNQDSFERIIGNLTNISRDIIGRFEIGIRVNVSAQNYLNMPQFIERISKNFAQDKRFVLIWQWVRDWGGDRIDKSILMSSATCKNLMRLSMERGMRCYEVLSCTSGTDICEASYKNGYVFNYNGKVYKCAMKTFENPEDDINCIGELDTYGNIKFDSQNEMKWIMPTIDEKCYKCIYFPQCMGNACPYTMVYKKKNTCILFKQLIPAQIEAMYHDGKYIKLD